MDIGSAVGRAQGVVAEKILQLGRWRESDVYSDRERLALALADAMSTTPCTVSEELFAKLRAAFNDEQLVELVSAIAWENYRARFNRAFDVEAQGFSEGAACALPARQPPALASHS